MKFEFEDYRIENRGTLPSRWLLDLHEQRLENRLPKQLNLRTSQTSLQYNVQIFDDLVVCRWSILVNGGTQRSTPSDDKLLSRRRDANLHVPPERDEPCVHIPVSPQPLLGDVPTHDPDRSSRR